MKRKIVMLVFAITVAVGVQAFSWGVGASFGIDALGGLPGQNVMLSVQFPKVPILWGFGARIDNNSFNLGVTADWWLINQPLVSFIHIYVGPGLYAALPQPFEFGARLPIGLNAYPVNFLEIFIEAAPAIVLVSSGTGIQIPNFRLQGALGLRLWFK